MNQTRRDIEGNHPRIAPLRKNYPAINTLHFKQILKNKFDLLKIAKLCSDIILTRPSKHTISLGKSIEVETGEEDAAAEDIKGSNYFARCIMVYFAAKIHFAGPASRTVVASFSALPRPSFQPSVNVHMGIDQGFPFIVLQDRICKRVDDPIG